MKAYQWAQKKVEDLQFLLMLKNPIVFTVPSQKAASSLLFRLQQPYGANGVTVWGYGRKKNKLEFTESQLDKIPFRAEVVRSRYNDVWTCHIWFDQKDAPKEPNPEEEKFQAWKKKWITQEVLDEFRKQGDTSEMKLEDVRIICKFFTPSSGATWWCYQYDEINEIMMCFANLGDPELAELGSVSLRELASLRGMFGLGVERDRFFGFDHTLDEVHLQVTGKGVDLPW